MQAELKILGILEGEVEKKLADCRKKIKLYTMAKKQIEIEAQQVIERRLIRIKEIRQNIEQLNPQAKGEED